MIKRDKTIILTARVVSLVFTPFYLPILGLITLFTLSYLRQMPWPYKLQVLIMVYLFTVLLPTVLIHLYRRYHGWTLIQLGNKERRMVPYVISILCYFACAYWMDYLHIPHFMSNIVTAALFIQIVCALINVWWNQSYDPPSAHAVAGGGRLLSGHCLRHYRNNLFIKYESVSQYHHGQHERPARYGESLQVARRDAGAF